jgi:hypothetical protein
VKSFSKIAVALVLAGCSPQTTGHPSWTSGDDNIAYAVSAFCSPYVFDGANTSKLLIHQRLVRDDGWRGDDGNFSQDSEVEHVRVGYAGSVHVAMSETGSGRQCVITGRPLFAPAHMTVADAQTAKKRAFNAEAFRAAAADAQTLRNAALRALAGRPEGFAPTKSQYLPGRFATEDMLCTSPSSAHPGGLVVLSAGGADVGGEVLLTMGDVPPRMPACDQVGVPMNYRTLVSDSGK